VIAVPIGHDVVGSSRNDVADRSLWSGHEGRDRTPAGNGRRLRLRLRNPSEPAGTNAARDDVVPRAGRVRRLLPRA
jgi:hypothetical protein